MNPKSKALQNSKKPELILTPKLKPTLIFSPKKEEPKRRISPHKLA